MCLPPYLRLSGRGLALGLGAHLILSIFVVGLGELNSSNLVGEASADPLPLAASNARTATARRSAPPSDKWEAMAATMLTGSAFRAVACLDSKSIFSNT